MEFTQPCGRPVGLPERPLSQYEVESYWIEDRSALVTCAQRHDAVVEFYRDRDSRIMAQ